MLHVLLSLDMNGYEQDRTYDDAHKGRLTKFLKISQVNYILVVLYTPTFNSTNKLEYNILLRF